MGAAATKETEQEPQPWKSPAPVEQARLVTNHGLELLAQVHTLQRSLTIEEVAIIAFALNQDENTTVTYKDSSQPYHSRGLLIGVQRSLDHVPVSMVPCCRAVQQCYTGRGISTHQVRP